jgi:hypothetical protein
VPPGDLAQRDAQDLMAYPLFSLSKLRRVTPIDFRMGKIAIRVEATPDHGMATIWDADVLIWAASQIVAARDKGLRVRRRRCDLDGNQSRRLVAKPTLPSRRQVNSWPPDNPWRRAVADTSPSPP